MERESKAKRTIINMIEENELCELHQEDEIGQIKGVLALKIYQDCYIHNLIPKIATVAVK